MLRIVENWGLSAVYCKWIVENDRRIIAMFRHHEHAVAFVNAQTAHQEA